MIIRKVLKWGIFIVLFKMMIVSFVSLLEPDPRRNIAAREDLCRKFQPNTVFIGTSRTLYGIDPVLFDSLNNGKSRTYNMGLFSLSPSNSIEIAKRIIKENEEVKNIFVELNALDYSTILLTPFNLFDEIIFRSGVLFDARNIRTEDKITGGISAFNVTAFHMFSIAPEIGKIKKYFNPPSHPVEGKPDLEVQGNQIVTSELFSETPEIAAHKKATMRMSEIKRGKNPNSFYLARITRLIELAKFRGKKVIFYSANNTSDEELLILSDVFRYISGENLVLLPGNDKPEILFRPENLFDQFHLNKKGSRIYTGFIYEAAKQKLTQHSSP